MQKLDTPEILFTLHVLTTCSCHFSLCVSVVRKPLKIKQNIVMIKFCLTLNGIVTNERPVKVAYTGCFMTFCQ